MTETVARMTRDMIDRQLPPRGAVVWAALVVGPSVGSSSDWSAGAAAAAIARSRRAGFVATSNDRHYDKDIGAAQNGA